MLTKERRQSKRDGGSPTLSGQKRYLRGSLDTNNFYRIGKRLDNSLNWFKNKKTTSAANVVWGEQGEN